MRDILYATLNMQRHQVTSVVDMQPCDAFRWSVHALVISLNMLELQLRLASPLGWELGQAKVVNIMLENGMIKCPFFSEQHVMA